MRILHGPLLAVALCLLVLAGVFAPSDAPANTIAFGNFSGYTVNVNDAGPAPTMSGGSIQITNYAEEDRSIFYDVPQNISSFTASFTYQTNIADGNYSGVSFVLQNSSSGANELPAYDYVGYLNFPATSCGVTLEAPLSNNGSGFYTKGNYEGGSPPVSPIDLSSGDPINVTLTYSGTAMHESLVDANTGQTYSNTFPVPIPLPTLLGGSTAYLGFGAYENDPESGYQDISNLQFSSSAVPEPSTLAMLGSGALATYIAIRPGSRRPGVKQPLDRWRHDVPGGLVGFFQRRRDTLFLTWLGLFRG
jgi:hypothetical protein